ncbi:MAG: hypothetical protein RR058_00280 [Oscillospiraceae bacterium]
MIMTLQKLFCVVRSFGKDGCGKLKKRENKWFDFMAALAGISDVDWDSDFKDDSYTSYFGFCDIDEPLFASDFEDRHAQCRDSVSESLSVHRQGA